ncbi:MAG: YfhO family protein, partial [Clostridia bacterium]|nr:YfhO family protein [Clostridia bacterium]
DFNLNSSGFTAHSSSDKTRLIYFSIPGDNGWKAYINDEPAEILTLNGGMMGLIVPEGENYIQFKFITPGLLPGIVISAFTLICLGIYSLIIHRKKKI